MGRVETSDELSGVQRRTQVDEVAILQRTLIRNAVADDLIDAPARSSQLQCKVHQARDAMHTHVQTLFG